MSKPSILTTLTLTILSFAFISHSQAQTLTDPGMSEHNYKMPNKAAKAKMQNSDRQFSAVMNSAIIANVQTAKYAVQPSSIMFAVDAKKEAMNINPLSCVANYKTQATLKVQPVTDEYSASLH